MTPKPLRAFSYGGGVQSTAALVLAAEDKIDFKIFLFANVGDDSEDPATLEYVTQYAEPYAEKNGVELVTLHRIPTRGIFKNRIETLWKRLTREGSRSIPIPVRMSHNGAPGTRSCTADFKMQPILRWQKKRGASKENPAVAGLGISLDESHRMRSESGFPEQVLEYPLLDLRIKREECKRIIEGAGLPVPPKSACFFCPFHSMKTWSDMSKNRPEIFAKAVELENILNERRVMLERDKVYFTRFAIPLDEVTEQYAIQGDLFGDYDGVEVCESGHCWT